MVLLFISACSTQSLLDDSFEDDYVKYENGILEYRITVEKPTPCHTIEKEEIIMESYPVQIIVDIEIKSQTFPNKPGLEFMPCIQVIDEEVVEGTINIGHKPGSFVIRVNGEDIHFTNLENE